VIVMTSNLGAKKSAAIGFGERADEIAKEVDRAVREFFPPEVFNRIDRIVPFRSLTPEVAERVTEKELAGLLARRGLADRHVFVFAHAAAVRRMAEAAFDERGGARSVQRWLDRAIAGLLSDELARTSHASMRIVRIYGGERGYRLHIEVLAEAEPDGAERELAGWIDRPLSALRPRLSEIAARLRAHVDSEAWASLETRMSELVAARGDPAAQRTLYWLDAFRAEHAALRDAVFAQLGLGRAAIPKRPHTGSRLRAAPPVRPFDREAVLDAIARTVFLERALLELEDPAEHAVLVEIARVGSGRRPPSYERAPDGFFEQLVRHYASARGEVVSAASRDERGRVRTASDPSVLLAARPSAVVLEIEGLAVRSLFAGEVGSHAWTSIAAGSEIVRVRIASGESAPGALDRHEEAEAHFDGALARGDAELPANPSALLPMVRRFSFDPPRPGELAPLEVEDFAAGHVEVATASDLSAALRATMLLQMSRSAT
jgi:ATP-dependent Clp protease ATP-binding subunit ClpC